MVLCRALSLLCTELFAGKDIDNKRKGEGNVTHRNETSRKRMKQLQSISI